MTSGTDKIEGRWMPAAPIWADDSSAKPYAPKPKNAT